MNTVFAKLVCFVVKQCLDSHEYYLDILPKRDVIDVLEVVGDLFMDSQVVATIGLCQASNTWAHIVTAALLGVHVLVIFGNPWARTDKRHVAFDDIDKLRQLIKRRHA